MTTRPARLLANDNSSRLKLRRSLSFSLNRKLTLSASSFIFSSLSFSQSGRRKLDGNRIRSGIFGAVCNSVIQRSLTLRRTAGHPMVTFQLYGWLARSLYSVDVKGLQSW